MAHPKIGPGPWGEAIRYWLPRKDMRQADLARQTKIQAKSISSMVRGFHTTTKQLAKVAIALKVPLEDVLVSPTRRRSNEELERTIREAVSGALRNQSQAPSFEQLAESLEDHITAEEEALSTEQAEGEQQVPSGHTHTRRKKSRKK